MLEKTLQNIFSGNNHTDHLKSNIESICDFWQSITPATEKTLSKIIEKYRSDIIIDDNHIATKLEFWKDINRYTLSPALEHDDLDDDYILLIEDISEMETYSIIEVLDDSEIDTYFELLDRLFYAWFCSMWQTVTPKGDILLASIVENSSSTDFSLIDFLYSNYSRYIHFDSFKNSRVTKHNRPLSSFEIFARANTNIGRPNSHISWIFENGKKRVNLIIKHNTTLIISDGGNEAIQHKRSKEFDNSHQVATRYFIDKVDSMINRGWKLVDIEFENTL